MLQMKRAITEAIAAGCHNSLTIASHVYGILVADVTDAQLRKIRSAGRRAANDGIITIRQAYGPDRQPHSSKYWDIIRLTTAPSLSTTRLPLSLTMRFGTFDDFATERDFETAVKEQVELVAKAHGITITDFARG